MKFDVVSAYNRKKTQNQTVTQGDCEQVAHPSHFMACERHHCVTTITAFISASPVVSSFTAANVWQANQHSVYLHMT